MQQIRTGRSAEQRLGALRAAGEPVCLADLAGKPIPAEENAATYLSRAKEGIEAIQRDLMDRSGGGTWNSDGLDGVQQAKVRAAFEAHPGAIPLLEQAAACKEYRPAIDFTLSPVGENLKDDGGTLTPFEDAGVGPLTPAGALASPKAGG